MQTTGQSAPARVPAVARRRRPEWLVPAGLIFLSLIPVLAGAARLTELTGGAEVTERNARFFDSPAPVLIHIVSVTVYSLLGAFQFVPSLRQRRRRWHSIAGRILLPAGLLAALSGLWMAAFYTLPPSDGQLLLVLRLVFGSAMAVSLILGLRAVLRRNFVAHGAWMSRAYAIGVGAGTQALILIVPELLSSPPDMTTRALLMGAAWVINLAVAEYFIRRRALATRPTLRAR
jgi:cytochrome bd-type quinol oxidase subunit 2